MNLLPRTSLSLIFPRNLTSLQKVSLTKLQCVPYKWISGTDIVYQVLNQVIAGVLLRPADDRRVREGDREGVRGQVPQGRTHHLDEHAPGNSVGFCYFLSKSFI